MGAGCAVLNGYVDVAGKMSAFMAIALAGELLFPASRISLKYLVESQEFRASRISPDFQGTSCPCRKLSSIA